ncbi:amidase [Tundrisphaera lichenicola]|uniref:amidase n=1 Tax=Tundrisphaera lichenicola TaxID=2029860 RepID=UPI003EBCE230
MKIFPNPGLTIEDATNLIASGAMSYVDLVEGCLARIDEWEPKVHAWVVVDRKGTLNRARELDQERSDWGDVGPLYGIPIGIKDIIDVKGLPTSAGVKLWGGGRPAEADADLVEKLKSAGAIILGKTVTTPYAWIDPPPTRNPWNFERTPGGSSSGSAAAVATGMCLGAFGTQTGGSIIRPAAFCGVSGFKPSRWKISTQGIVPFARTLDTPGPIASSVEGLRRLYDATASYRGETPSDPGRSAGRDGHGLRFGRLRGLFESLADQEMTRALEGFSMHVEAAGAVVVEVALPPEFDHVRRSHRVIMAAEAAVGHRERLAELPQDYPPRIAELIREGIPILASDYIKSHDSIMPNGTYFSGISENIDAFLMPAAIGEAPDRSTTGDPIFNSCWTYLDFPAVTLPIGLSKAGLPLAIQLVHPCSDAVLLDVAVWCEQVLRNEPQRAPRD